MKNAEKHLIRGVPSMYRRNQNELAVRFTLACYRGSLRIAVIYSEGPPGGGSQIRIIVTAPLDFFHDGEIPIGYCNLDYIFVIEKLVLIMPFK